MKNRRVELASLMAVAVFLFTVAAIAPPALASRGQAFFTDVNGQPKPVWRVGETLFVTVIDPDENRDRDEVELLGGPNESDSAVTDALGNTIPVIEICVNGFDNAGRCRGDAESSLSGGSRLVLQETGVSTGVFRSFSGLRVVPLMTGQQFTRNNGVIEVHDGDALIVRYLDPNDHDVNFDLGRIDATRCNIAITDRGGSPLALTDIGRDIFVTLTDADENTDPVTIEAVKGVVLRNERTGETLTLTLIETGPNTGVFRNVDGITLMDDKGPGVMSQFSMKVLDKDTLVAYCRAPAGAAAQPRTAGTRTDRSENAFLILERTVPTSVQPNETFNVKVTAIAKTELRSAAIEELPDSAFRLISGRLRELKLSLKAGDRIELTYQLRAGAGLGQNFSIRGSATPQDNAGQVQAAVELSSSIAIQVSSAASNLRVVGMAEVTESSEFVSYTRSAPDRVGIGETFTVRATVTAKQDLRAVAVEEGVNPNAFQVVSGKVRDLKLNPKAGETLTLEYQVKCIAATDGEAQFAIIGRAIPQDLTGAARPGVRLISQVRCAEGPGPAPAVGLGDQNDQQDFSLFVTKIAEPNPSQVMFTDVSGREKKEYRIGEDLFVTVNDDDQNVDSDRVERIVVSVYNVNGGREVDLQLVETGINTGIFRNSDFIKIVSAEKEAPGQDVKGILAVHNGDTIYVEYRDARVEGGEIKRSQDPFDIAYNTATISNNLVLMISASGAASNKLRFINDAAQPVERLKVGQDLFVEVDDSDQNEDMDLVETINVRVMDARTGDWESVTLEETGPNTGVFQNREGLPLRKPDGNAVPNDGVLQVEDRDFIEVQYSDPNNEKDFSARLIGVAPQVKTVGPERTPSKTLFANAQGQAVTRLVEGAALYVAVDDMDKNLSGGARDSIAGGALTVTVTRGGQVIATLKPDLMETDLNSGRFMSNALQVEGGLKTGDVVKAMYVDPTDPSDKSEASATVESAKFELKGASASPQPATTKVTIKAVGSGIDKVSVTIYNLAGGVVFSRAATGDKVEWTLGDAANGVYLFVVTAEGLNQKASRLAKLVVLR